MFDIFGLIPARAGNTLPRQSVLRVTGAHPRSRGEHRRWEVSGDQREGSSPLARGTHDRGSVIIVPGGLIPARAGNT